MRAGSLSSVTFSITLGQGEGDCSALRKTNSSEDYLQASVITLKACGLKNTTLKTISFLSCCNDCKYLISDIFTKLVGIVRSLMEVIYFYLKQHGWNGPMNTKIRNIFFTIFRIKSLTILIFLYRAIQDFGSIKHTMKIIEHYWPRRSELLQLDFLSWYENIEKIITISFQRTLEKCIFCIISDRLFWGEP